MDNSVICKSGWLYRKVNEARWDKSYVELYRDGYFKYYENDHSPNAEDIIFMPTECISIKTGYQIEKRLKPPLGHKVQNFFSVSSLKNKTWIFCAESLAELTAWQINLEEARFPIIKLSCVNDANTNHFLFNQSLGRTSANILQAPIIHPQFNPQDLNNLNYLSQALPPAFNTSSAILPPINPMFTQSVFPYNFVSNVPLLSNYPNTHGSSNTPMMTTAMSPQHPILTSTPNHHNQNGNNSNHQHNNSREVNYFTSTTNVMNSQPPQYTVRQPHLIQPYTGLPLYANNSYYGSNILNQSIQPTSSTNILWANVPNIWWI